MPTMAVVVPAQQTVAAERSHHVKRNVCLAATPFVRNKSPNVAGNTNSSCNTNNSHLAATFPIIISRRR